jgi:hypothetical protein
LSENGQPKQAGEARERVKNHRSLVAIGRTRSTYDDTQGRRARHAAAWPAYARRVPRGPLHHQQQPVATHMVVLVRRALDLAAIGGLSPAKVLAVSEFVATPSSLSRNEEPNRSVGGGGCSIGPGMPCYRWDRQMPSAPIRRPPPSAERSVPVRDRPRPAWSCPALQAREILPPRLLPSGSLVFVF